MLIVNITIPAYTSAMRRKPGALVPLESDICITAVELLKDGTREFHGYELAKQLAAETSDRQLLAAYGTLYRALGRLVDMGMLTSRWENPQIAAAANRPRRGFSTVRRPHQLPYDGDRLTALQNHSDRRTAGDELQQ